MEESDSEFRKQLEEERDRLKAELERLSAEEQENPGYRYSNHMADEASDVFEQAKNLALRQNLERLLAKVEGALTKIEKGTYGMCEECGRKIALDRLRALPYATLCFECQQRRERS
ncbi:MAG: TraR/DksA C4-type zinc finger protein [Chloroflexota bacterium]|nr:TraR/DksA C4-type zinc finger protein [Chloroflexota bacterium]